MSLCDIRLADIKRYAQVMADRGVARSTVRIRVSPVRLMLATAVEDGLLRSNPADGFRNIYGTTKANDERVRALRDDEVAVLIGQLPAEHRLLVRFLVESGLRIGEAIELRWHDLDVTPGSVAVRRRYYRGTIDAPKSRFGVRTIPLGPAMQQQLADARAARRADDHQLVFPSPAGGVIDTHNFRNRIYKPAAVRAGVPWATLHALRHTCASRLFRSGWSAKHVQLMLGHHSPAFTLATYVHLMPGDLGSLPIPPAP